MQLTDLARKTDMATNGREGMRTTMRTAGTLAAALLLMAGMVVPLVAQNQTTTGQIRGRVLGDEGQPVQSVVVTARNEGTGLVRTALTGAEGLYALRLLPPGTYRVSTEVIGFADAARTGVRVVIGRSTPVNFELQTRAVEVEGLTVTSERPPIDVADGGVTQYVSQQEIESLPALGRDFTDFINLSGLVAPDPGETTGGQFSIAGQRASQTLVQIDGVDGNNSFFGENRGGSRIPFVFSLESIREFQIITNGFDVEYGRFGGGIVNVVTKSGTNDFQGSLYGNFRDDALTAPAFIEDPGNPEITTDYEVQQFAGSFSGPIVRDKAFFLLSVDAQRRREPQLPLTRSRFGPGGAEPDPTVFGQIGEYFDVLESQYGVENPEAGYQPFETTNDALTIFGRVDWNLNQDNRLSVRHNFSTYNNDNEWNGNFDFAYGLSRAEKIEDDSHSFVTELQTVIDQNTFNVLRFQFSDEKR
ncbi:MAG: TonB-dependent receptor, partial [Halobacteriales archaeon]|nr:TonB-dependent receptor [Halobacteriales archaeon]